MSYEGFDPNQVTFDEGLERIKRAATELGLDATGRVVTSKDEVAVNAQGLLNVSAAPDGFQKWQLPVYLDAPSQMFISVADPGVEVPEHAHDEGDSIRFIVSGSIVYDDVELSAGDWMFIPARTRYSFKVGLEGAKMCSCYCCCCIARADLFGE